MPAPLMNLAEVPLLPRPADWAPPPAIAQRIAMRSGRIGSALGLTHLGCSLVAVPPGKQAFPFHNHRHNDELFVVLAGTGELRYGSSRQPLREGDVVGSPPAGRRRRTPSPTPARRRRTPPPCARRPCPSR